MSNRMKIPILSAILFLCGFFVICLCSGNVFATKFTVDDDGGADFSKIQDAIDAAGDGDLIQVSDGTYYENIIIDKRLTITGDGTDLTTINGGSKGDVVTITGDGTSFSGFSVIRSGSDEGNAAIVIKANDTQVFQNLCEQSVTGISLTSTGGDVQSRGNEIFENECSGNELGISLSFTMDALITRNNCSDNSEYGINVINSGTSLIHNNTGWGMKRGILVQSSNNITITNNNCRNNIWTGINLEETVDSDIIDNHVLNNEDGIGIKDGERNTITGNNITGNANAIYLLTTRENLITRNTVHGNSDRGIFIRGSQSNTLNDNSIMQNPMGIVLNSYLSTHSSGNLINGNVICDNQESGMDASVNGDVTVDATDNFWGHATGPFNQDSNPGGKGDNVTDFIDFDPWVHVPEGYVRVTAVIGSITPNPALVGEEVTFLGSMLEERDMEAYVWESSLDGELSNDTGAEAVRDDLSAGVHIIGFRGIDHRGILSITAQATITVHEPPAISNVSVTPPSGLDTDDYTFTVNATDDGAVEHLSIVSSLDGQIYDGPANPQVTVSGLSNGTHTIILRVRDDHGVWSQEANITLPVNGRPVAVIVSVTPNPATIQDSIVFAGLGMDDGNVSIYQWTSSIDGVLYFGPNSTFPRPGISLGDHTIEFRVQDDRSVWSFPDTIDLEVTGFVIRNKIPTIQLIEPANGTQVSERFRVKGTATDEDGTITKVELSIGSGEWRTAQGTDSWSLVLDAEDMVLGNHTITLRSFDGTNYSKEIIVIVEVVEPEEDSTGFIPGFGSVPTLVGSIAAVLIIWRRRRERFL